MTGEELLREVQDLLNDPTWSEFGDINRAYRELCRQTNWVWLQATSLDLLTLTADKFEYEIDVSRMRVLRRLWVRKVTGNQDYVLVEQMPPQLFEDKVLEQRNPDGTVNTTRPKYFKQEGPIFTFSPRPDQTYATRIDFTETAPLIDSECEVNIPLGYEDIVALNAAGRVLMRPGQPPDKFQMGQLMIQDARTQYELIIAGTHPNRTRDIDRKAVTWLR